MHGPLDLADDQSRRQVGGLVLGSAAVAAQQRARLPPRCDGAAAGEVREGPAGEVAAAAVRRRGHGISGAALCAARASDAEAARIPQQVLHPWLLGRWGWLRAAAASVQGDGGGSRTRKHSEAGCGRPEDGGVWTAKTIKRLPQQPAHPQYANYWAPLTRKRHIPPHPAKPQHTNHWAP